MKNSGHRFDIPAATAYSTSVLNAFKANYLSIKLELERVAGDLLLGISGSRKFTAIQQCVNMRRHIKC